MSLTPVLISGGGGFLGFHLVNRLLTRGDFKLFAWVREETFSKFKLKFAHCPNLVPVIARQEQDYIDDLVRSEKISGVIHLATDYGRDGNAEGPIQANLTLPVMMLSALIKNSGAFFVNADSYFNKPGFSYPILLNYSLAKKALVLWLQSQSEQLSVSNVVLEHLYGPGDKPPKFVPTILEAARNGKLADLQITGGEQLRDWLFVEDAVSAFELVIEKSLGNGPGYKEYFAGTGYSTSLKTFVEVVAEVFGQESPVFGSRPYSSNEIWESYADLAALSKIGFTPKFSIRSGIERCFNESK